TRPPTFAAIALRRARSPLPPRAGLCARLPMAEGPASREPAAFLREHVADRLRRRIADRGAQVARLERELEDRLAAEATLEFVLEGDGGGAWFVNVHGEDVRGERAPARPPLTPLSQSRADREA